MPMHAYTTVHPETAIRQRISVYTRDSALVPRAVCLLSPLVGTVRASASRDDLNLFISGRKQA